MKPKERIEQIARELGLVLTHEFIPWSKSRSKNEKHPSLNWRVTLKRMAYFNDGYRPGSEREILSTDYMAGIAHCPSYQQRQTREQYALIKAECETGLAHRYVFGSFVKPVTPHKPIIPESASVICSLVLDGSATDYATFEDWAAEYGYDPDSRKAEACYRQCLEIGLKLHAAVGDDGLRKLREACEGY